MLIEQAAQRLPTNETPQKEEHSIFDFYSVVNENRFLGELDKLPQEEKVFYIKENVLRFLNEYVGKVPYTKISYLLKPHGLEFAGIRTGPVYHRTALMAGDSSREADEWVGYREIENELLEGEPGMTWISPTEVDDYSLVFHFQKNPHSEQVDEYVLRYDESLGEISDSQKVLKALQPNLAFMNTSAFLRNPLTTSQPDLTLQILLNHLGVDNEEIERSKLFEEEIKKRIWPSVERDYVEAISEGNIEEAEKLLTAYFNWAKEIKYELDSTTVHMFRVTHRESASALKEEFQNAIAYFSAQKAAVVGGGSCPVTRAGNSTPFSSWNIYQNLKMGLSIETTIGLQTCEACQGDSSTHFHCPGCGGSIESGKGITTCPHCDLSKDDYAKQTGVSC